MAIPLPNALLLIPQNPVGMSYVRLYTDGILGMEGGRKGGKEARTDNSLAECECGSLLYTIPCGPHSMWQALLFSPFMDEETES